jgi:TonB family protein
MKGLYQFFLITFLAMFAFLTAAMAQEPASKAISGGVLNGKAIELPKPEYPAALREAKIEGMVAVSVLIDEAGNVIAAHAETNDQRVRKAEDGTALDPIPVDEGLRQAAVDAALRARFSPTTLSGQPVKVRGSIVYNFVSSMPQPMSVKTISGGVLNGRAIALPQPAYPAAAKAVKASGQVNVQITINEDGSVMAANAVSGHPLLQAAAVEAARNARFEPTMLSGAPVKVSGILTYNFVIDSKVPQ